MHTNIEMQRANSSLPITDHLIHSPYNFKTLSSRQAVRYTGSEIVNMIGIFYDTTSNSHDQAKRKGMVTRWKN